MENEKKSKKGLIIGISVAALLVLIVAIMGVSSSNSEVRLRNQAEAQEQVCKNNFDNMFKQIAQVAQVADQYKETFKEVYPALIEGRYKGDQTLMKWVTESNPNFDTKLYNRLVDIIEAKRDGFQHEQDKLADIVRAHKDLLGTWPSSMFVGGREPLHMTFVSSSKTKETYRTGEENDIDVFPTKK
jgi:hypothetical protein